MSPVSGSNVPDAQGLSPKSSSLRKIPRYCTLGGPIKAWPLRCKADRRAGVTSAHHTHGDTPMRRESSKRPKAVPRRSLPATTQATETPGTGRLTLVSKQLSQRPRMPETSMRRSRTSRSIVALCPSVPTMTSAASGCAASVRMRGRRPVTCSTSSAKASAATRTTLASPASSRRSAARSPATSGNEPAEGASLTLSAVTACATCAERNPRPSASAARHTATRSSLIMNRAPWSISRGALSPAPASAESLPRLPRQRQPRRHRPAAWDGALVFGPGAQGRARASILTC